MDFDQLFSIIIILIIWGISAIMRRSPKDDQDDSAPAGRGSGLLKILQQGITALEEKNQSNKVLVLDEYIQPISAAKPRKLGKSKESLIEMAEHVVALKSTDISAEVDYQSPPTVEVGPRQQLIATRPCRTRGAGRRRELQNAVVWAEILAPPVALRD